MGPGTEGGPQADLSFGGDAAHAWDRLRWKWLVGAVAVFGLVAGSNGVVIAHPAQMSTVSGSISAYQETYGKSTSRHLYLEGAQPQSPPNHPHSFPHPSSTTPHHAHLHLL